MDRLRELNAELDKLAEKYQNPGEMNAAQLETAWKEIDKIKSEAYAVSSKLLTGLTRDSNGRFKSRDNVEFDIHEIAEISTAVDKITDRAYYEISRINTPERVDYPPYTEYYEEVAMPEVDELNTKLNELIEKYQNLDGLSVSELEAAWKEIDEIKNSANAFSSKMLDGLTRAENGKFISRDNVEIDIHEIAQLTTAIDELTERAYDEISRINRFEVEKKQQEEEKEKERKSFIYETGRKVIDLRRKIRENNNSISKLEEEINNIRNELSRYSSGGLRLSPEQQARFNSLRKVLDAKEEELGVFKDITTVYQNEEKQLVEDIRAVQNGGPIPNRQNEELAVENSTSNTLNEDNIVNSSAPEYSSNSSTGSATNDVPANESESVDFIIEELPNEEIELTGEELSNEEIEILEDELDIEPPEMPRYPIEDEEDLVEQEDLVSSEEITNTSAGSDGGNNASSSDGANSGSADSSNNEISGDTDISSDSTNNEETEENELSSDDLSDNNIETNEEEPERPIVKGNNPKVTWKTVAATAVGIGIGAGVFFAAGPLGVGVMTLSGKLAKALINRKINKLAQAQRLGNNTEVQEISEPQPGLKGAFNKFKNYLGSEEGLRDMKWMINAAIVTGTALSVASSIQNMMEPKVVEPTPVEPTPVEPTPIEPTPIEPDVLGYDDITLGGKVDGFNISTGHDSAGWAVNDINAEILNSKYVTGDSIFNRFASINPDGSLGQIIDTRGLSLADFCAQNNIDPSTIAVDVARADGASQAWIAADQLLNIGGPSL